MSIRLNPPPPPPSRFCTLSSRAPADLRRPEQYCVKEYCLICCAQKTTCIGCGKKPSRSRLVEASARLKRVQQGMASGFDGANSALGVAPALSTPTEESKVSLTIPETVCVATSAALSFWKRASVSAVMKKLLPESLRFGWTKSARCAMLFVPQLSEFVSRRLTRVYIANAV